MKDLLRYLEDNRRLFDLPEGQELAIELHAPWSPSFTGRCMYKVRPKHSPGPLIAIQDRMALNGKVCAKSPYEPEFHRIVNKFLPARRGAFEVDGSGYFWSEYVDGPSLKSLLLHGGENNGGIWTAVSELAGVITMFQEDTASESSAYIPELLALVLPRIEDESLSTLLKKFAEAFARRALLCSWSHGDLWLEDVLYARNAFFVLDWEWALNTAPIGSDLIDLYITSAEHILNIPTEKAWRDFLEGRIVHLQSLRREIQALWSRTALDRNCRKHIIVYALIRSMGRVMAQNASEGIALISTYLRASIGTHRRSDYIYRHAQGYRFGG